MEGVKCCRRLESFERGHLCMFYWTDQQREDAALTLIKSGLDRNDMVICVGNPVPIETLRRLYASEGRQWLIDQAISSGQLVYLERNTYLFEGTHFDLRHAETQLKSVTNWADSHGFAGVQVLSESKWGVAAGISENEYIKYEISSNILLEPVKDKLALACFYDFRVWESSTLISMIEAHPHLELTGSPAVLENIFYIPPEDLLQIHAAEQDDDHDHNTRGAIAAHVHTDTNTHKHADTDTHNDTQESYALLKAEGRRTNPERDKQANERGDTDAGEEREERRAEEEEAQREAHIRSHTLPAPDAQRGTEADMLEDTQTDTQTEAGVGTRRLSAMQRNIMRAHLATVQLAQRQIELSETVLNIRRSIRQQNDTFSNISRQMLAPLQHISGVINTMLASTPQQTEHHSQSSRPQEQTHLQEEEEDMRSRQAHADEEKADKSEREQSEKEEEHRGKEENVRGEEKRDEEKEDKSDRGQSEKEEEHKEEEDTEKEGAHKDKEQEEKEERVREKRVREEIERRFVQEQLREIRDSTRALLSMVDKLESAARPPAGS